MSESTDSGREAPLPPQVIAEAGVWIARLNGPNSVSAKRGLRRWLAEADAHRRAFALATDVWDEAGALRGCAAAHLVRPRPLRRRFALAHAAAVAAAILAIAAGSVLYFHRVGFTTGVGEQRLVTLEDGTRVLLNTSTHLVVNYDRYARRVALEHGEALFDVSKNPQRPFVVTAGGREVTALGTSFDVRREGTQVMVALLEGKVTVADVTGSSAPAPARVEVLDPGQRLIFTADGPPRLDRPQMQKVTDWQRGRVSLDNLSLADAVTEMNRYSIVQLKIERPEAASLRVSGIFRAGDSISFARAVAQTYGLIPLERTNAILLTGLPARQPVPDAHATSFNSE